MPAQDEGCRTLRLSATYRLQLTHEFPLGAVERTIGYLARLGVSHIYASPMLAARRGSTHGYDVIDPTRLNPELGTDEQLARVGDTLATRRMSLLLDIVPNHAAATAENAAWDDVLLQGRRSPFAAWFDIDWDAPGPHRGLVVLPVLGDRLPRCLARGEIRLVDDGGRPRVRYFDRSFPVDPATVTELSGLSGPGATLADAISRFDGPDGQPRMQALLDAQHYRLVHWRRAARDINYRRFFEVNDLVALRVEDPTVFAATHARVLAWVGDGIVSALRIDHIDGLLDPAAYLETLAAAVRAARPAPGSAFPIVVEKILGRDEQLPPTWPVAGTTGYDFANALERVFIAPDGLRRIAAWYRGSVFPRSASYPEVLLAAKRRVLRGALGSDVARLARLLSACAQHRSQQHLPTPDQMRTAIVEVIARLDVYRTYRASRAPVVGREDRRRIERAVAAARTEAGISGRALDLLADVLLGDLREDGGARLSVVQRFQLVSGPAMAKGAEDTAFYVWVPLLSLNEVGGEPDASADHAVARLHSLNADRGVRWPHGLSCTSTHDTKRSADVRSRLDVLSEMPDEWTAIAARWHARNKRHRPFVRRRRSPDRNLEYLLYQALVGIWPLPRAGEAHDRIPSRAELDALCERTVEYATKAAREAKVHTSWIDPESAWEEAMTGFVRSLFDDQDFLVDVAAFVARIVRPGLWNALARTLVHCTAPGVPDVYQGDEVWNFRFVDPDNRQAVDFELRERLLGDLEARDRERGVLAAELAASPEDLRSKLHVIRVALECRRRHPELFAGGYRPLAASGRLADRVLGFARVVEDAVAITVVPRLTVGLGAAPPIGSVWEDTTIDVPAAGPDLVNVLTSEPVAVPRAGGPVRIADVFRTFPLAVLVPKGSAPS